MTDYMLLSKSKTHHTTPGRVHVVGAGLAGVEASWQLIQAGIPVTLHEMRPLKRTPAHETDLFAELVCSNSLKSLVPESAPGLLKREMLALSSLVIQAAYKARVPAGMALAVDRTLFSKEIESSLMTSPLFEKVIEEVNELPSLEELASRNEHWIIATGPLTTDSLSQCLGRLAGSEKHFAFYDAIAPVLDAESLDFEDGQLFWADRWQDEKNDKNQNEDSDIAPIEGDYLNVPLSKDQYHSFVREVLSSQKSALHDFEDVKYFESCLPIEVMAERGVDTLRFGPMKPVGLTNPRTGRWAYACVQLRAENLQKSMLSMVGFQTKMKWPEQKRVFAMLPGFKNVEFHRMGSVHRNSYLNSPKCLSYDLSFRSNPFVTVAGQITGVEGYTESAAIGLLAGRHVAAKVLGSRFVSPPASSMLGSLLNYVTVGPLGDFQPMNANLGLLPTQPKVKGISKADRKAKQVAEAWQMFEGWKNQEHRLQ